MTSVQQQLEWATDPETVNVLIESLLRDLDSCRRVCEKLQRRLGTVSLHQMV
jgi:hypothetical protein